ncbi:MAG: glycosyltransferase [Parcubacteria group bacterium]|nr:glycosyltransferase [Parcubacteria group bacterium]
MKNSLDIGFVTGFNSYPPKRGRQIHAYNIAESLMKLGHRIHVFEEERNPHFMKYPRSVWGHLRMAHAVDLYYIRVSGSPKIDAFTLQWITRKSGKPIFWEVNSPLEEQWVYMDKDLGDFNFFQNRRRRAARYVRAASCVSQEMATYAKQTLGIREVRYIPNGSDPSLFTPDKGSAFFFKSLRHKVKILWAGSPQFPWQGLPLIYHTAKTLLPREDLCFILVGVEGHLRVPLLSNMRVIGRVEYARMPHFIASADICLTIYQPPSWSPYGFYNSPLKLFDYMACARPVVASNMGEMSRIIKHDYNGFLVSENPQEIARYLVLLSQDKNLRKRIGRAARKDVINFFNWERAAKQTEEVLRTLIKS